MDVNETIVAAWMESKEYFIRKRLKYDLSGGTWSSVSDVDVLGYRPNDDHRVAVLVSAWMTMPVSPSFLKKGKRLHSALSNFVSTEATTAMTEVFGTSDQPIERWLVLGRIGSQSRELVLERCREFSIAQVFEFREVLEDSIEFERDNHWSPHASEVLQTIRALKWTELLSD